MVASFSLPYFTRPVLRRAREAVAVSGGGRQRRRRRRAAVRLQSLVRECYPAA